MNIVQTMKCILVGTLVVVSGILMASQPLGDLEIRGKARVVSADGEQAIHLHDTNYAWYSGDRLYTGEDANGILNLAGGGTLGIDKNSDIAVSTHDASLAVEIEAGSLLYALGDDHDMRVTVGEHVLMTYDDTMRAMQVSNESASVAGVIHRTPEGDVKVSVRGGKLVLDRRGQHYEVSAGERATLSGNAVEIVSTQLDRRIQDDDDDDGLGAWIKDNPGLFSLALVGTAAAGYGIYEWQDDDDDDDEGPVSP